MYLVKVKHYETTDENTLKSAVFTALFSAVSHSDAETQALTLADFEGLQEPHVTSIVPKHISDVLSEGKATADEPFFAVKVIFFSENHKGKVKKIRNLALVQAPSSTEADAIARERLKTIIMPFVIDEIKQTNWDAVYTVPVDEALEVVNDAPQG